MSPTHTAVPSDSRPRDEWNLDTWARDVGRLIDSLGLVRPIILGVSFGGVVAQKFASMSPDAIGGMILISTFSFADLEEQIEMFRQLGGDEAAQAARDALTPGDSRPDDARERFLEICGDLYTQSDGNVFGSPRVLFNHEMAEHFIRGEGAEMDLRGELGEVTAPTLILAGALDPITPASGARQIRDLLGSEHVEYVELDNCGHGTHRDRPDETFAAIRSFVEKVRAASVG